MTCHEASVYGICASTHPGMLPTKVVVLRMRPYITCHAIYFLCMLDMCTFSPKSPSPLQRPRARPRYGTARISQPSGSVAAASASQQPGTVAHEVCCMRLMHQPLGCNVSHG